MSELRYEISDWHQLKGCLSNNSKNLSIRVSDFTQNDVLTGTRIQVEHTDFGPLFSCVLNAQGSIVTEINDNTTIEFTPERILQELAKYGFIVEYVVYKHLPSNQITYLKTLLTLGYDKIRLLNVYKIVNTVKEFKTYIIAFNIAQNPIWINNGYAPYDQEFTKALKNGSAFNISAISKTSKWDWSWLTFVGDIQTIIDANDDTL